jgi:tryptophan 2,3-dioxygenase
MPRDKTVPETKTTYWDYLHLPELLRLQHGIDQNDSELAQDELHFIMVHQVFELWFKLAIHEIRLATSELAMPDVPEDRIPYVRHHLDRVTVIVNHMVDQVDVIETLTPQDFVAFRNKLTPASGLHSHQHRIIEILLGAEHVPGSEYGKLILKSLENLTKENPTTGAAIWQEVCTARAEPSLRQALHSWLMRTPIDRKGGEVDPGAVEHFIDRYLEAYRGFNEEALTSILPNSKTVSERLEKDVLEASDFLRATELPEAERADATLVRVAILFIESYRELPLLAWPRLLLDTVVDLEQKILIFRSRHAKMVDRIIGQRVGTGGTSGSDYLHGRIREQIFPELWKVRTLLVPRERLPELANSAFYNFDDHEGRS